MRSRLLASMGALALTMGGLLATAGPAAADPAHCSGWGTHPDYYSSGGIHFLNGTNIHTGPYTDCNIVGDGYSSQGINAHCGVTNDSNYLWVYVVDTSTGKAGWARIDALSWDGSRLDDCYDPSIYFTR